MRHWRCINRRKNKDYEDIGTTVDSHKFELAVIRSSRLFEAWPRPCLKQFSFPLVNLPLGKPSVTQHQESSASIANRFVLG